MMIQKERTKKAEQAAKEAGLVKIHPLVPVSKVKEVLAHCKAVREEFKLDKGKNDEK